MKISDCASNVNVKNVRVGLNRIILRSVVARQRGADIKKKHPLKSIYHPTYS